MRPLKVLPALLAALLTSSAALAAAGGVLFIPPREKIAEPYTNDKCLKNCHGEEQLMSGTSSGQKQKLFVDVKRFILSTHGKKGIWCVDCHAGADPNTHPREGYPDVDCRACHSAGNPVNTAGNPVSVFPPGALEKLAKKGVQPPPKEARKGEGWMRTAHAWAWELKRPNAPFCNDCHTEHYILASKDPASPVNRERLAETCSGCHPDQVRDYGVGGVLAKFRIQGHGKGDISGRYDLDRCLSCHQGEAAHAEETLTNESCPACHRPREATAKGESGFHLKAGPDAEGPTKTLSLVYAAMFWVAAAAAGLWILFFGYTSVYREEDKSGEDATRMPK